MKITKPLKIITAALLLTATLLAASCGRNAVPERSAGTEETETDIVIVTPGAKTQPAETQPPTEQLTVAASPAPTPSATAGIALKLDIDPDMLYSRTVILKDTETGNVFYSLDPDKKIYPASLTKIMTALLAAELLPDGKEYTITEEILDIAYSHGASTSGFNPGETTDKNGILAGILLASGADCSYVAAIEISGSEENFVELMNSRAQEMGLDSTHFVTCTGLHDDGHYTTASDLMKLTEIALKNSTFTRFFSLDTYEAKVVPERKTPFKVISTVFSGLEPCDLGRVKIIGGKTGYTRQAGLCLVTYAEYDGHRYLLVTGGGEGNTQTRRYHFLDAEYIYGILQKTF